MPDSFQSPIGGRPKDPFDKYRVEEIQKDRGKQEESDQKEGKPPEKQALIAAYVSRLFKKILDLFTNSSERGLAPASESRFKEHLAHLKIILETLMNEDKSQDPEFLNRFSEMWHHLLEDMLRFKRKSNLLERLRSFVKEIQKYPIGQPHSLGYYLSEYAGQKWLPFPYMEMIYNLHTEHLKDSSASLLTQWVQELEQMASLLDKS